MAEARSLIKRLRRPPWRSKAHEGPARCAEVRVSRDWAAALALAVLLAPAASASHGSLEHRLLEMTVLDRDGDAVGLLDLGDGAMALAWQDPIDAAPFFVGIRVAVSEDGGRSFGPTVNVTDRLINGISPWAWTATDDGFAMMFGEWRSASPTYETDGATRLATYGRDGSLLGSVPLADGLRLRGHFDLEPLPDGRFLLAGLGQELTADGAQVSDVPRLWAVSLDGTWTLLQEIEAPASNAHGSLLELEVAGRQAAVVWSARFPGDATDEWIHMARSNDGGTTFGEAQALDLPFQAFGGFQLSLDDDGTARMALNSRQGKPPGGPVFRDADLTALYLEVPLEGGPRWVLLNGPGSLDPHIASADGVGMAVDGDRVVLMVSAWLGNGWTDEEVQLLESLDGGRTFSPPFVPILPAGVHIYGLAAGAAADDGRMLLLGSTQQPPDKGSHLTLFTLPALPQESGFPTGAPTAALLAACLGGLAIIVSRRSR